MVNESGRKKSPTVPACHNSTEIKLGGKKITYSLRESSRAKRVNLKVSTEKGLEVVVPANYPHSRIEPLLKNNENWIIQKLDSLTKVSKRRKNRFGQDGQILPFLGRNYRLVTVYQQGPPLVELVGDKVVLMLPQKESGKKTEILEAWLRYQAKEIIANRVAEFKNKLGVNINQIFIKDQKTRWGSCSSQGNLNFNFRIIMAPLPVLDYLVVHELAHLIEMNHSKKFWSLVESLCPEYKRHRQWLKEHGQELMIRE
ncbi:M48 family metallopeptidase [Desulforamulus aquiferis]|uniref:M48 family metallopeptidase n=1 Tax=Desulforamulus aquiferis TaxID=1397668 RepID=UPI0027152CAF|nr:SprT family zinc-dependent metalloprotease [Desulforamulus aquiferis]